MKWKKSGKDDTLSQNLDYGTPDGQTVPSESGGSKKAASKKKDSTDNKKSGKKRNVILFLIFLIIFCGILFYVFIYKNSTERNSKKNAAESTAQEETNSRAANIVSASGTTRVGVVEEEINLKYLSTDLAIEKIYVNNNTAVKKGDKILKVTDDSVKSAKQELENALANAEISYRAGVITEKESEIQAKYTYDSSILAGQQAQDVYNASVTTLQEAIDTAQKAIDDANDDITEYSDAINKGTYDTKYNVTWLYNKYQNDVTLLKKKVSDWGLDWAQVTGSSSSNGGTSTYLATAKQLYTEVNTEYNDYKSAKAEYDDAMTTAKYGLQKLQLQMTSLQNALTTAKNNYAEQSIVAKDTYNQTVATAKIAKDTYNTAVKKAQEQLDTLAAEKDTAQNNLNNFTSTVGDGYMYAPTNGTIMHVTAKAGNYLNSYTKVFAYSDSDIMTVSASVGQAYIDKLEIGESAMIVISKYGNYTGKITSINPVSSSTSKSSITYTVTITLSGDISKLKENQTAQVIFGVGGEKNAAETTTVSGNDVTGNDITGNNAEASEAD